MGKDGLMVFFDEAYRMSLRYAEERYQRANTSYLDALEMSKQPFGTFHHMGPRAVEERKLRRNEAVRELHKFDGDQAYLFLKDRWCLWVERCRKKNTDPYDWNKFIKFAGRLRARSGAEWFFLICLGLVGALILFMIIAKLVCF